MFHLAIPWWTLIIRPLIVYIAMFLAMRLFGKREVGQFTLFDLILILLVSNALQPAMTGPDASVTGGIIILITLVLFNLFISYLRVRFPNILQRIFTSSPTILAKDGCWNEKALHHEMLTKEDCESAIREHGIDSISEVKEMVLEPDGSISVVPKEGVSSTHKIKRRVRIVNKRS